MNDEELLGLEVEIEEPGPGSIELMDHHDFDLEASSKPKRRLDFLNIPNSALLNSQKLFSNSPIDHSLARSS